MSEAVLLLRRARVRGGGAVAGPSLCPRRRRGRRRRSYPEHRVYRARCSFLELSEEQVLRRYRLDKAAIAALCCELAADLESVTGRSHALPVAVKVTSALAFLASGSFQAATRDATGISQSAMSNCLAQFLQALQRRAARYIAFPPPAAAAAAATGAFPGVLGLVGGMHVALRAPAENEPAYRNAADYHSMNMQVVCDATGAITNVVAKFPGSCPNAAVLENSALARLLDGARPDGAWLLGDGSYPLKPWLMTPIAGPRGPAEERYNALHHGALGALRRTLALLRLRFGCLARGRGGLQYAPPKVCQIFLACCVLHNVALRRRLELPDGLPPPPGRGSPTGAPPPGTPPPPGRAAARGAPCALASSGVSRRGWAEGWGGQGDAGGGSAGEKGVPSPRGEGPCSPQGGGSPPQSLTMRGGPCSLQGGGSHPQSLTRRGGPCSLQGGGSPPQSLTMRGAPCSLQGGGFPPPSLTRRGGPCSLQGG